MQIRKKEQWNKQIKLKNSICWIYSNFSVVKTQVDILMDFFHVCFTFNRTFCSLIKVYKIIHSTIHNIQQPYVGNVYFESFVFINFWSELEKWSC